MKKKIYILTGASGHVGQNIINELLKEDCEIRGLVLPEDKTILPIHSNLKIYYGNILDMESLKPLFEADSNNEELYVIHAAGMVSIRSTYSKKMYRINVEGTKNILEMCKQYHVQKMVYISSVHAIQELPKNETIVETDTFDPKFIHGPYAKTKAMATSLVLQATKEGLNACVVHPSGILGPFDANTGHLNELVKMVASKKLHIGVKGAYDLVDVRDVASGTIAALKKGKVGECYILSGHKIQMIDFMNMICEMQGIKKIKRIVPTWILKMIAPFAELHYKVTKKTHLFTRYSFYTLNSNSNFSCKKAIEQFNYHRHTMEETLKDTLQWLSNIQLIQKSPIKIK